MNVLEFLNFNRTKVKTSFYSKYRVHYGKCQPFDFLIITVLDDQLHKQKNVAFGDKQL